MNAYAGIDVAFAKNKRLPVCVATWLNGRLVPLPVAERAAPVPPRGLGNRATLDPGLVAEFAEDTADYLHRLEAHYGVTVQRVAIDAPSAPKASGSLRRRAESALDAQGVNCFATPSLDEFDAIKRRVRDHLDSGGAESRLPHANQLWMLVGFALFQRLQRDWECLEVFPQATAQVLGASATHKRSAGGVEAQLGAAARFTGWPEPLSTQALRSVVCGPVHDGLDSYLSAWVAALDADARSALGAPPTDAVWVPNVDMLSNHRLQPTAAGAIMSRRG